MTYLEEQNIPDIEVKSLEFAEWRSLSAKHYATTVHDPDYLFFSGLGSECLFADIGANIGNSIHSLNLVNPDLKIISFEPNPGLWAFIEQVIDRVTNEVTLFKCGLSDRSSSLYLYIPIVDNIHIVGESSVELQHFSEPIVQKRLRSYSKNSTFNLVRTKVELKKFDDFGLTPTHIKIDVEGHELKVLEGMIDTIKRCKPVFLIENDRTGQVETLLTNFNYSAFNFDANSGNLVPKYHDALNTFFSPVD